MKEFLKISAPTLCPSCNSELELVKDQLFCRNNKCSARAGKQLEHYCKTMKIKGMGPKRIEKLGITSIPELYELTIDDLNDAVGEKVGATLMAEIEKSKVKDFPTFLAAFSIPLIGTTAASKLGNYVTNITNITPDLMQEAGLGEKARANLWEWIEQFWYLESYHELPVVQTGTVSEPREDVQKLSGTDCVVVVITGKLDNFKNRGEAKAYLEGLGFSVRTSVTKVTQYLIDEEGRASSSRSKAEQYGVPILTIKELENLFANKD
jgi:DNA ligase (NAD+)